ncbi:hypothetical protein [Desulfurispora thermophila]|uniref:hypothetical protein n=1 Tax=Desulfurispora thermophila TaxID=265470 RepID=UPI00035D1A99|nr:hypothetical protein [Desulfurispora thermophila]
MVNLHPQYETIYLLSQIQNVRGRRYNIGLHQDEQVIKGYCYEETTAGFFRAWVLNEMHVAILKAANQLIVAGANMLAQKTGLEHGEVTEILEECVTHGILCENQVRFRSANDGENIFEAKTWSLYIVDTGGIHALKDAGIPYRRLPYTTSIDQRLRIYRRNIYLVKENAGEQEKNIIFLEDMLDGNGNLGTPLLLETLKLEIPTVVLYDSTIARILDVQKAVGYLIEQLRSHNLQVYDIAENISKTT